MKAMKKIFMAVALMAFAAPLMSVSASGPLIKRVEFTINSPFEMQNSDIVLPAGKYIFQQVVANDLNLFALYRNDLTRSPIAMVRTTRISYNTFEYPQEFTMLVNLDREVDSSLPVVAGWAIPGDDGWEITSIVPDRDKISSLPSAHNLRRVGKVKVYARATY